jgi:hypothetical protein
LRTASKTTTCSQRSYTSSDDEHDEKQHDNDDRPFVPVVHTKRSKKLKTTQTDILTVIDQATSIANSHQHDTVQTTPPRSSFHTPKRNTPKEKQNTATKSRSISRTPSKIFSEKKIQQQNQIHELTIRKHAERIETLQKENEQLKSSVQQLKQKIEHYERTNSKTQSTFSSPTHSTQSRRSYVQVASSQNIPINTNK